MSNLLSQACEEGIELDNLSSGIDCSLVLRLKLSLPVGRFCHCAVCCVGFDTKFWSDVRGGHRLHVWEDHTSHVLDQIIALVIEIEKGS